MDTGELTVVTDHSVIKSMATALKEGKHSNHLNNWVLFLSRYAGRMMIRHREGKSHQNADGLSRLPTQTRTEAWTIDVTTIEPTLRLLIVQNLSSDKHLQSIYIDIMQQIKWTFMDNTGPKTTKHNFRVDPFTKLLYMIDQDGHSQLCIPKKAYKWLF